MFCTRCGHDVAAGTRFCPNCGSAAAPPPQPAAAPPPSYSAPAQPPPQPQYAPPAYGQPPGGYGYNAAYANTPQWSAPAAAPAAVPAAIGQYAGFWRRVFAYLIDGFLLGIAFVGVMFLFGMLGLTAGLGNASSYEGDPTAAVTAIMAFLPIFLLVTVVGGWLYFAMQESSTKQATLGKRAIGIKVTDSQGTRLSFGHATGRYFAKIVTSLIPFGIGWMLAGWTAKKQAIHDMLAGTLVVCG